jgi:hypothetical protein
LVADTVKVYVEPFVNPVTLVVVAEAPETCTGVCAVEPMYGVTVYFAIALPPSSVGIVQLTCAAPLATAAATLSGAVGTVGPVGVTAFEGADTGPDPFAFDACTVNVYDVPWVSPGIVTLVAGGDPVAVVGVWAAPPTYGVTVYVPAPPGEGADQLTVAELKPAVALTLVTCPGGGIGANITSTQ